MTSTLQKGIRTMNTITEIPDPFPTQKRSTEIAKTTKTKTYISNPKTPMLFLAFKTLHTKKQIDIAKLTNSFILWNQKRSREKTYKFLLSLYVSQGKKSWRVRNKNQFCSNPKLLGIGS